MKLWHVLEKTGAVLSCFWGLYRCYILSNDSAVLITFLTFSVQVCAETPQEGQECCAPAETSFQQDECAYFANGRVPAKQYECSDTGKSSQ